jgi:maltokinase
MTREEALRAFVSDARWFGGKGREFELGEVRELPLGIHLVEVRYADGDQDTYQLPLSAYDEPQDRLGHAFVGDWDGRYHYDAVHDRDEMARWLAAFADAAGRSPLQVHSGDLPALDFHRVPGHDLDVDTHSSLFSGEQSNSSVAFGEDSLMKVFRRITPGANPDIEIHRVLTEAGSEHVAHLYGWIEVSLDGRPVQLAMLQQFLRTATEGWVFALTSVRNLFAEADLYPEEVGGDFAGEAHRLGVAVAEVHETMRKHFPTQPMDVRAVAEGMRARLEVAVRDVPEIGAHRAAAEAAFDRLAALDPNAAGEAQRIHGDLHLGQTLRTSLGWKIVDFEGEPAKPLKERLLPDSPWRDVAGMLRSLDYAAQTVLRDFEVEPDGEVQLAYRGQEWVERNRAAFLQGYAEATVPLTDADHVLIGAYELDKAVYECRYEARNRPEWLGIPLAALARAGEET